ncbi:MULTISPECIES: hypothetical protein [Streptomyces]|uniref:hypothetical protein n=1 Tax=Streptomyces TaxID=1883 RepID=UPI0004CD95A5|nr:MULTISPECIES: hypothetical protein [Streptomyces]KOT60964.1 hypothetical protein ADK43_13140 [Streptomyces rimosus subsp. rimosus]
MNTFKTGLPGAWLMRSAGRHLVALLVVSAVVASVLPLRTRFGGGGELGYPDGVGSLLAATWLCFALAGWVWVLLVLLVLLPMRRRMEAPTFRGLAWYLLSLPTPLAVPGPSMTANGREKEGDVRAQVVGG